MVNIDRFLTVSDNVWRTTDALHDLHACARAHTHARIADGIYNAAACESEFISTAEVPLRRATIHANSKVRFRGLHAVPFSATGML